MLIYRYKAVNLEGELETGYRRAREVSTLRAALQGDKQTLLYVLPTLRLRPLHLRPLEWIQVFYNLKLLLEAGLPLLDALQECHQGVPQPFLRGILRRVCDGVKQGRPLEAVFASSGLNFPRLVPEFIALGNQTGDLGQAVSQVYTYLCWQEDLRTQVRKALRYPLFLVIVLTGVIGFLNFHVVPLLRDFFMTMQGSGSQSLALFEKGQGFLKGLIQLLSIGTLTAAGLGALSGLSQHTLVWRDRILYYIPDIRDFTLVQFFQTLTVCLEAHLDLLQALELATRATHNHYFQAHCQRLQNDLRSGKSLHSAFESAGIFPDMVVRLLRVSEMTGSFATITGRAAALLDHRLRYNTERMTAQLEPILILVLGGVLLFLIISLFSPLYDQLSPEGYY